MVRDKALQDRCIAKEGVVTRVRKHNATLMNEQGQYKEAVRTLNQEVKKLREKLVEAGSQRQKLQEEATALRENLKHRNRSLTLVLITTARGLTIVLSRWRQLSQSWTCLGFQWMHLSQ